jgi:hypothetical protein
MNQINWSGRFFFIYCHLLFKSNQIRFIAQKKYKKKYIHANRDFQVSLTKEMKTQKKRKKNYLYHIQFFPNIFRTTILKYKFKLIV